MYFSCQTIGKYHLNCSLKKTECLSTHLCKDIIANTCELIKTCIKPEFNAIKMSRKQKQSSLLKHELKNCCAAKVPP